MRSNHGCASHKAWYHHYINLNQKSFNYSKLVCNPDYNNNNTEKLQIIYETIRNNLWNRVSYRVIDYGFM